MSGVRLTLVVTAALIVATTTVNVFSLLHDEPQLAPWEPVVWEYSSGLSALLCLIVPLFALRFAFPGPTPWPRLLAVHAVASLVFSVLHVAVFVVLRHAAYGLAGQRYGFDLNASEFLYEYRKDLLGYVGTLALFWIMPRWLAARRAGPDFPPAPPADAALFEIRDGARLLRVPPGDVVAVNSAGNYVEVILADGRRPLTRATLTAVEAELAPRGFVRVHRSWLVNAARVRALEPAGSGDHLLELEGGVTAPLSRRFPQALERLRSR